MKDAHAIWSMDQKILRRRRKGLKVGFQEHIIRGYTKVGPDKVHLKNIQDLSSAASECWITLPSGAEVFYLFPSGKIKNTLVSLHGGPESFESSEIRYLGLYRELLRKGWAIAILNYRGSTCLNIIPQETTWGKWKESIILDFMELQCDLRKRYSGITYHLLGGSFGGTLALIIAQNFSVKKVLLFSPLLDLPSQIHKAGRSYKKWFADRFSQKDIFDFSLSSLTQQLNQKVFLIGSTRDQVLDTEPLKAAFKGIAIQRSNWIFLLQPCRHTPTSFQSSYKRYQSALSWLIK